MKKSNLDEMQEQQLLKIEHNGCWLAFWGLLAAMAIQGVLGAGLRELAGEWIVFMALCIYMVVSCLRHGIWDRRLKADGKTIFLASLLAGCAVGIFTAVAYYHNVREWFDLVLIGGVPAVFTFVLCFAALSACAALYRKRRKALDQE